MSSNLTQNAVDNVIASLLPNLEGMSWKQIAQLLNYYETKGVK